MPKELTIRFDESEVKGALEALAEQWINGEMVRAFIRFFDADGELLAIDRIDLVVEVEANE